jgi:hypothetical protein
MIQIGVAVAEQIGVMDMHDLSVVRFGIGDYAQKSVKVRGNRSGILRNMGGAPQHARAACAPVQYDGGAYNYRVVGLSCHVRKFSADVWGDSRTKKSPARSQVMRETKNCSYPQLGQLLLGSYFSLGLDDNNCDLKDQSVFH